MRLPLPIDMLKLSRSIYASSGCVSKYHEAVPLSLSSPQKGKERPCAFRMCHRARAKSSHHPRLSGDRGITQLGKWAGSSLFSPAVRLRSTDMCARVSFTHATVNLPQRMPTQRITEHGTDFRSEFDVAVRPHRQNHYATPGTSSLGCGPHFALCSFLPRRLYLRTAVSPLR